MESDEPTEQTAVVQGDLSMNLFMVLLSVLATLAIAAAAVATEGFRKPMLSEPDRAVPELLSPGWSPVPQVRQRLIVRMDGLYLLDLDGRARALSKGEGFRLEGVTDSSRINSSDPDPQAHQLILILSAGSLPPELYHFHVPTDQILAGEMGPEWDLLLDSGQEVDLLVYPDTDEIAWHIASALYHNRSPFRLLFQSRKNQIGYQRSTKNFTFEDFYK
mmetsp:Transcript_22853/g.38175  ORF Transcript_22853/g.38175 Transcript_22853/m.38175 type:complete len:218 (-) Transcript_22853:1984-2637(-)